MELLKFSCSCRGRMSHEWIFSVLFKLLEIQMVFCGVFRIVNLTNLQQSKWELGTQWHLLKHCLHCRTSVQKSYSTNPAPILRLYMSWKFAVVFGRNELWRGSNWHLTWVFSPFYRTDGKKLKNVVLKAYTAIDYCVKCPGLQGSWTQWSLWVPSNLGYSVT